MKKKIIILSIFLLLVDIITKYIIDIKFNLMETKEIITNFFFFICNPPLSETVRLQIIEFLDFQDKCCLRIL